MKIADVKMLKNALVNTADLIVASEAELTKIDTLIGDGDHGIGMKNGFSALKILLLDQDFGYPYDLFHAAGLCLLKNMGGTSGVLFGTLLIGGLNGIKDKKFLNAKDILYFFEIGYQEISRRGKAKLGDKTMVDALYPAIEYMKQSLSDDITIYNLLNSAYEGALAGVENTKDMLPRQGRSKNFREKALGYPDPGAVSISLFFKGMSEGLG